MSCRHYLAYLATLLLATNLGLSAQKRPEHERSVHPSTYTSPDGTFRFLLPAHPHIFERGHIQPSEDCKQDAIVCVVYPKSTRDGRVYGDTTFQVRTIVSKDNGTMTADICVTPYPRGDLAAPEFFIDAKEPTKTIGRTLFVHGSVDSVAGPQSNSIDLYLTFHNQSMF